MIKLFEDDISVIFDRFSSIKCLLMSKTLVNAKPLVVGKLLADGKLFSVGKHLESIQMLTDLTYLTYLSKVNFDQLLFYCRYIVNIFYY